MPPRPDFRVDWASYAATKYAVTRWHYSRSMPAGKMVKVGAWEGSDFIGAVVFSRGANKHLLTPYGLSQTEGCELTRVALRRGHGTPVSRIVAQALRFLKVASPGMRLVVSYADVDEGHHGGIYQAGNWIYEGLMGEGTVSSFIVHGRKMHKKTVHSRGVKQSLGAVRQQLDPNATEFRCAGKHKYLMPLDDDMRARVAGLAKPYPKRAKQAMAGILHPAQRQGGTDPHAPTTHV